ncbi:unnamed protein product, partial [Mycena citricolor]
PQALSQLSAWRQSVSSGTRNSLTNPDDTTLETLNKAAVLRRNGNRMFISGVNQPRRHARTHPQRKHVTDHDPMEHHENWDTWASVELTLRSCAARPSRCPRARMTPV